MAVRAFQVQSNGAKKYLPLWWKFRIHCSIRLCRHRWKWTLSSFPFVRLVRRPLAERPPIAPVIRFDWILRAPQKECGEIKTFIGSTQYHLTNSINGYFIELLCIYHQSIPKSPTCSVLCKCAPSLCSSATANGMNGDRESNTVWKTRHERESNSYRKVNRIKCIHSKI